MLPGSLHRFSAAPAAAAAATEVPIQPPVEVKYTQLLINVMDDADVDQAVELAHRALFFNQIDGEQFKKILSYAKSGVDSGATLVTGGDRIGNRGFYIQPTVFADVEDDMKIAQEEILGPVQSILKLRSIDLDEVIRKANATHYGLAAGVFTRSLANTPTRALRVGTVWVNCYDVFDAAIPYGGYKMSGIGREKGAYSLRNHLQTKSVVAPIRDAAWL